MKASKKEKGETKKIHDETLSRHIGYQMKRAFNVIQADLLKTLAPFELRMLTYTALVLIVDNPGLRQSQLADAMDIERPNLVVIIDELERRELITRDRVPTDRRAYSLNATLSGHRLYEKANAAVALHEQRLFKHADQDDRTALISALALIRKSEDS